MKLKDCIAENTKSPNNFKLEKNGGVYSLFNNGRHVISFPDYDWIEIKKLIEKTLR